MAQEQFKVWEDSALAEWVAVPASEVEAPLLKTLHQENIVVFDCVAEGPLKAISEVKVRMGAASESLH